MPGLTGHLWLICIVSRLKDFIVFVTHSCSMDPGCITPEYVYRMWGGTVCIEEIQSALDEVRK